MLVMGGARSLGWTRATVAGRNHAMPASHGRDRTLVTPDGLVDLREYPLRTAGRQGTILRAEALYTVADETRFFASVDMWRCSAWNIASDP
jgi:hypothetical protein